MTNDLSAIEAREPTFQKLAKLLDKCSTAHGCEECLRFSSCIRAWDEFITNFAAKRESSLRKKQLVALA
jgi:hypothetical protein